MCGETYKSGGLVFKLEQNEHKAWNIVDNAIKFKFKSFIVRYTEQLKVRLGTEILKTRQRKHLA